MLQRFSGLVVLAALAVAVPACKKKAPTVPDSVPDPAPKVTPTPNPNPGSNPNPVVESWLPNPPHRPMFGNAFTSAAARDANLLSLKQIGIAFHSFADTNGGIPLGIADKNGKIGLSWRVALLPYIEQDNLYRAFKLDEPWDSEHNRKLIPQMPKLYAPQQRDTFGYTFYRSFSGKDAVMPPPTKMLAAGGVVTGPPLTAVRDGTSNTLFVAEAYDPVIWTKPDELPFTAGSPPKLGGGVFGTGFCGLRGDGATEFFMQTLTPTELNSLIQTNDGK